MKVNVIGACNIDITATPYNKVKMYDSNPGKVKMSLGGVGRNIAHNMALLGLDVEMFTALSTDDFGKMIKNSCNELNIKLDHAIITNEYNQSIYLCINDNNGDLMLGSSDMDICKAISLDYIKENIEVINQGDVVVFDTNLDEKTIEYIISNVKVKTFVDMVSTTKCEKLAKIINNKDSINIFMVKANKLEAEILGNRKINNKDDLYKIAEYLHSKGIENICITLGEDGAFFSNKQENFIMPNMGVNVVNSTGAGDSFLAGMIYGFSKTTDYKQIIDYGLRAAKITLESIEAVSEKMSENNINKK